MPLMRFAVTSRVPYAADRRFGSVGAYEQVDGTAHFAVDPIHPANARICDLKLAPRNGAGLVEFATDLSVVLPVDVRHANGRCIVELPNRGRRRVVALMNCAPPDAPVGPQAHPGDGFLFARGYTVTSIGWQWDVCPSPELLCLAAPTAMEGSKPIGGETMVEIRPNERGTTRLLADRIHRPLPAAPGGQLDARLLVRDWEDGDDTVIPRRYFFACAQHAPGYLGQSRTNPGTGTIARYPLNVLDYRPLHRAALINLDLWITESIDPPPSRYPRRSDTTAVERKEVLAAFARLPCLIPPDPVRLPFVRTLDMGGDEATGMGRYPALEGAFYPALVSAVDADGNETAGIRMPDITVPVGPHAGWNPRDPVTGSPEQIVPMNGLTLWFAPNEATRMASGDPRRSLAERYRDEADYGDKVRGAAARGGALPTRGRCGACRRGGHRPAIRLRSLGSYRPHRSIGPNASVARVQKQTWSGSAQMAPLPRTRISAIGIAAARTAPLLEGPSRRVGTLHGHRWRPHLASAALRAEFPGAIRWLGLEQQIGGLASGRVGCGLI